MAFIERICPSQQPAHCYRGQTSNPFPTRTSPDLKNDIKMHILAYLPLILQSAIPIQAQEYGGTNVTNSTGSIPQCALECINSAKIDPKVGCDAGDFPCPCQKFRNMSLIARPCIQKSCNTTQELAEVCPGLTNFCNSYKVPIPAGCVVNVTLAGDGK